MSAQSSNESGQTPAASTSKRTLPSDVYPESLSRVPVVRREETDDDGKRVYDVLMGPQTRTLAGLQNVDPCFVAGGFDSSHAR